MLKLHRKYFFFFILIRSCRIAFSLQGDGLPMSLKMDFLYTHQVFLENLGAVTIMVKDFYKIFKLWKQDARGFGNELVMG